MPALITHDLFGKNALLSPAVSFIKTQEEQNAFLLGNQGPDPLFYCIGNPLIAKHYAVGSTVHHEKTPELFSALSNHLQKENPNESGIVKAWTAGFVCHYLLDRVAHPFIYAQQYSFCEAGEEGLSDKDGSDVHAVIESELDEMMLYARTGQTVATFAPEREILKGSKQTLSAISVFVTRVINEVYDLTLAKNTFAQSVISFRHIQSIFHSPHNIKRQLLGKAERLLRNHSFIQAMSHRPLPITVSEFDNHQHEIWENPFTHAISSASFTDLFNQALQEVGQAIPAVLDSPLSFDEAKRLTRGENFSGDPTPTFII